MKYLCSLLTLLLFITSADAKHFSTQKYLGTEISLTIEDISEERQSHAIELLEGELVRLENILSTYKQDSEISRLNKNKLVKNASPEVREVINLCLHWQDKTNNQFSCRMGSIKNYWQHAKKTQVLPNRIDIRAEARALAKQQMLVESNTIKIDEQILLDVDGLAKGYIIDKVYLLLSQKYPNSRFKIDIGGDGRLYGDWPILFVNPNKQFSQESELTQLQNKAYASSGMAFRFFKIKHHKLTHILAPRDGWPVEAAIGTAIVAEDATTADAVATALSTMPGAKAINWLNKNKVAGKLYFPDGRIAYSKKWRKYDTTMKKAKFAFTYEIPDLEVTDYRKPYVSIWLTDNQNNPIKQLVLLGDSERWWQESRRWWRKVGRKNESMFIHVAQAKRKPGQYTTSWLGEDDFGMPIEDEQLILHVEVSREDGDISYQRISFSQDKPTTLTKKAKGEIGELNLTVY